jgi:UDP-N-acetyl-2-amino-2-deoxyglucuronate dehydrogenase
VEKVNFAIIGCGHIAKKHAAAIETIPGARLAAVCDVDAGKMADYARHYGAKAYPDLRRLLADPAVEIVNICTPSGHHAAMAMEAARAKKHVLVEKPLALTLEEAEAVIKCCRENRVKLAVVHPNRFRPAMMELRKLLDRGLLGKLSHANVTVRWNRNQAYYDQAPWRGTKAMDGGVLMNQAIHSLDLLLWLMGQAVEVQGITATRLRQIEAEDVAVGNVRFASGALGVIEAATTIYPQNLEESISIFGEKGSVKIGGKTANRFEILQLASLTEEETREIMERVEADPLGKPGHQWIMEDMIRAVQEDEEPAINGEEGKKALALVLALYRSAESGQRVKLS